VERFREIVNENVSGVISVCCVCVCVSEWVASREILPVFTSLHGVVWYCDVLWCAVTGTSVCGVFYIDHDLLSVTLCRCSRVQDSSGWSMDLWLNSAFL
jgi:hypothetical protein